MREQSRRITHLQALNRLPADLRLLHQVFEHITAQMPDNIALDLPPAEASGKRRRYTYAEINRLADHLACHLAPLVKGECLIALLFPRGTHLLYVAQLAVLKAGAAFVCIDPTYPAARVRFMLEDSEPVAVLTATTCKDLLRELELRPGENVLELDEWVKSSARPLQVPLARPTPMRQATPGDLCYVIYTSGTTGRPKGVMIEHRNIMNLILSNLSYFDLNSGDRVMQSAAPVFDASIEEMYLAFAVGAALVLPGEDVAFMGPDLVPWMKEEGITAVSPTPTFLRLCHTEDPERELPRLRLIYVGGETLPEDLVRKWAPGRWLENAYGPTECTVTVLRGRAYTDRPTTIGKPVKGNRVWVLDENLEEVVEGVKGELCIAGSGVARGYLNRPGKAQERFLEHREFGRIYRTGDLVERLATGELAYHGRLDSQVKLRGYRVELESIEAHLAGLEGVKMAACKVQGKGGERQLAAYLIMEEGRDLDRERLRRQLGEELPHYMLPSYFKSLPELPTQKSGKLDRQALPDIQLEQEQGEATVLPRNELEALIAESFAANLSCGKGLSIHDDFFDLGGNSVRAAQVISELRLHRETATLTIRDLYESPTVARLAGALTARLEAAAPEEAPQAGPQATEEARPDSGSATRKRDPGWPKLVTAGQLSWIFFPLLAFSAVAYLSAFFIFPFMVELFGAITFIITLPAIMIVISLLYIPLALVLAVFFKKVLIGRYEAGRHPVWSWMFFRNWLTQGFVGMIPWSLVQGTVFQNYFLRALGARIGKNVHIHSGVNIMAGGWDLLEIGDNVTIARDAGVRLVDYSGQELIFAPISIGDNCTLSCRSGMAGHSRMERNSYLTELSMVPAHATVPEGEMWDGVPAAYKGPAPGEEACQEQPWSEVKHGLMTIAVGFLIGLMMSLPGLAITLGCILYWQLTSEKILGWLFAPVLSDKTMLILMLLAVFTFILSLFTGALYMRLLGRFKPGTCSRWRGRFIILRIKQRMLEAAGTVLSGTLFWPWWLRLAGMRIGRISEMSTITEVVPELVELGPETFLADGVYLGVPHIHRGVVRLEQTTLGQRTFIGNHAVIPTGTRLPRDVLIGVCTVADSQRMGPGSSWFGHPIIELPRREVVSCDRRYTHNPSWLRYANRLFWECLRFLFPLLPLYMMLVWFKTLPHWINGQSWPVLYFVVLPLYGLALGLSLCLLVWALKWLLLGRVKPGQHAFWSCWVFRWDFMYMLWGAYARPVMRIFHDSLVLSGWLRLMGSQVGKRVLLSGAFSQVVDPDMLRIEDDATVVCFFQAHSFEDRVLKIGPVHLDHRCTVRAASVLLYNSEVGRDTQVAEHSVLMKNESLLPELYYVGCPTMPAKPPDLAD